MTRQSLLFSALSLVICGTFLAQSAIASEPTPDSYGLELPQSFSGVLPCADCDGIRHHLDLWDDGVFHLRREWLKGDEALVRDDLGRWEPVSERPALVLRGGAEAPLIFDVTGPAKLRATDIDGNSIASDLPYDLAGLGQLEPTDIAMTLTGEVIYLADAMVFEECLTGRSYPVSMEGDYLSLELAYLDAREEPGAPVFSLIEGQIVSREGMEGGPRPTIVVDQFLRTEAGAVCMQKSEQVLADGEWRILSLLGQDVPRLEGGRDAILTIAGSGSQWGATVGCNQMRGALEVGTDGRISFGQGMSTMMACPPPLDEAERALSDVLAIAASYELSSDTMKLFDAEGVPLATLAATNLP